ncbi:MAG: CocE/NonD family hydrolase [Chloroflexia bacterium]
MQRKTLLALLGLGLAAYGLLPSRKLLARWLRLPAPQYEVEVEADLAIPMPDGVILRADHYFPRPAGSYPTLLIRTPYGRRATGDLLARGMTVLLRCFAERGYHVLIQDVRGRFDSGGTFEPMVYEAGDGLATVEWLAGRPWFNGTLGMWGPSYLGYAQWAVASQAPSCLKALVPIITFSRGYGAAYIDGAPALDLALNALFLFDTLGNPECPPEETRRRWRRRERILAPAFRHLPLLEADRIVLGRAEPFYRSGSLHPEADDPFWQALDHRPGPGWAGPAVHLISGWYDLFLRELLNDYAALRAAGHSPYLTVGPWYHMDLAWVPEALREGLAWFDAHLHGQPGRLRKHPVRLYVLGANEWRELEDWPPAVSPRPLFLQAHGLLSPQPPTEASPPDRYRYDPADPTPNLGGGLLFPPAGPMDNRPLEARPDVLSYTTPPLKRDLEVIGPVRLQLYVRSSLAHTDFFGRLCDVHPNGRSINLCDGLFRIEPGRGERLPDGTLRIEVDMWATACRFRRGHRIRLLVSSGAHPRWARNLGLGEPPATATRMAVAEQEIYHDPDHPSALLLPAASPLSL